MRNLDYRCGNDNRRDIVITTITTSALISLAFLLPAHSERRIQVRDHRDVLISTLRGRRLSAREEVCEDSSLRDCHTGVFAYRLPSGSGSVWFDMSDGVIENYSAQNLRVRVRRENFT